MNYIIIIIIIIIIVVVVVIIIIITAKLLQRIYDDLVKAGSGKGQFIFSAICCYYIDFFFDKKKHCFN